MSGIGNKLISVFNTFQNSFASRSPLPVHPDWWLVQWGYIAVIFMALLLTTIPVAVGNGM